MDRFAVSIDAVALIIHGITDKIQGFAERTDDLGTFGIKLPEKLENLALAFAQILDRSVFLFAFFGQVLPNQRFSLQYKMIIQYQGDDVYILISSFEANVSLCLDDGIEQTEFELFLANSGAPPRSSRKKQITDLGFDRLGGECPERFQVDRILLCGVGAVSTQSSHKISSWSRIVQI